VITLKEIWIDGLFKEKTLFYFNGNIKAIIKIKDDKLNVDNTSFYVYGKHESIGKYTDGKKTGAYKYYDENEKLIKTV
jgi:antitoxin component YwqK of YwqJK toxin-antitoxin module